LPETQSGARPPEVASGKQAFVFTWPIQIFQLYNDLFIKITVPTRLC
jgi:hypothetical protein